MLYKYEELPENVQERVKEWVSNDEFQPYEYLDWDGARVDIARQLGTSPHLVVIENYEYDYDFKFSAEFPVLNAISHCVGSDEYALIKKVSKWFDITAKYSRYGDVDLEFSSTLNNAIGLNSKLRATLDWLEGELSELWENLCIEAQKDLDAQTDYAYQDFADNIDAYVDGWLFNQEGDYVANSYDQRGVLNYLAQNATTEDLARREPDF